MRKFLLGLLLMMYGIYAFSGEKCALQIQGYNIVKNSIFPFFIDKKPACFFAYYTTNPDPHIDTKGNGNAGQSI